MNELQMTIAVKLIEAQKRVAEHDIAEKARIKEQKEIRKTLYKKVTDLQQMYDSGVLQDDLPGINEPTN